MDEAHQTQSGSQEANNELRSWRSVWPRKDDVKVIVGLILLPFQISQTTGTR